MDLKAGEERPKAMNCWLIKPGKKTAAGGCDLVASHVEELRVVSR